LLVFPSHVYKWSIIIITFTNPKPVHNHFLHITIYLYLKSRHIPTTTYCNSHRKVINAFRISYGDLKLRDNLEYLRMDLRSYYHMLGVSLTYKTGLGFAARIYLTFIQLVTTFHKSLSSTGHSRLLTTLHYSTTLEPKSLTVL
jgi:hypothetical protein